MTPSGPRTLRWSALIGVLLLVSTACTSSGVAPTTTADGAVTTGSRTVDDANPPPPPTTLMTAAQTTATSSTTSATAIPLQIFEAEGFTVLLPAGWTLFTEATWEAVAGTLSAARRRGTEDYAPGFFADGGRVYAVDLDTSDQIAVAEAGLFYISIEGWEYELRQNLEAAGAEFTTDIRRLQAGKTLVTWERIDQGQIRMTATIFVPTRSWFIFFNASDDEALVELFDTVVESFVDLTP